MLYLQMLLKISGNKLQLFKSELTSVDISASVLSSFSAALRMCAGGRRFASISYDELKAPRIKQTSEEKKPKTFQPLGNKYTFFSQILRHCDLVFKERLKGVM